MRRVRDKAIEQFLLHNRKNPGWEESMARCSWISNTRGWMKFGDEGGKAIKGNLISYIRSDPLAATQYDWFVPNTAAELTQEGLSRINQSIEAFWARKLT